jgi:hypothetical protein
MIFPPAEGILLFYAILTNHPETRGGIRQSPVKDMGFCGRVFLLKLK